MTAVIGILNKNAVAIAADSAVTVTGSNGRKIYNTANKIFTLSKYQPISIIIYNSANFITTPWEIIIKIYRNELADQSFNTLKEYSENFFKFLKKHDFFSSEETIEHYLESLVYFFIEDFVKKSYEQTLFNEEDLILKSEQEKIKIISKYLDQTIDSEISNLSESEILVDFKNLSKKKFKEITTSTIDKVIDEDFSELGNKRVKDKFSTFLFDYLKSKEFFGQWTGLIFAGYGENEIYPTVISTKVAGVFNEKIRYYTDGIEKINDINSGSIMPFAQRDVIDTLISGISPDINETLFSTFQKFLIGYNGQLVELIEKDSPKLAHDLSNLDLNRISREFIDEINEVRKLKHIEPTVDTVSVLSKEDLAEMAESLIYLTYLKRRISSHEESVGGPVDVAIISKGDGFIWIKRKHYFEKKHNPHFNKNYFKS